MPKSRLIAAGLKKPSCEACGLERWNGKRISLELDHVDGDRFDNRLETCSCFALTVMLRPLATGERTLARICTDLPSGDAGIGRRDRLKTCCPNGREGSSPSPRTNLSKSLFVWCSLPFF